MSKKKPNHKFNIITPLIPDRISNLYVIKKDIESEIKKSRFEIQWYVFFDFKGDLPNLDLDFDYTTLIVSNFQNSFKGNVQRNIALDLIKDGYVCYMDDDNRFHPYYFDCMYNYINYYAVNYDVFIGSQLTDDYPHGELPEGILKVGPNSMKKGLVDGHQITHKKDILGDLRWNNSPGADGELIETLHSRFPEKFVFIEEAICYHNYFKSNKSLLSKIFSQTKGAISDTNNRFKKWIQVKIKA